jgi:acetolactate synthase-1/2/3 large subunit
MAPQTAVSTPRETANRETRAWVEVPADEVGDAVVAAMALGDVEVIFFTSGSEIGFFQEATAKARAQGRKTPRLITVTHEHANLNAALGYAMVSGKPAATAAHVDVGTQHYGGAVHTALHSGLPVLITSGAPPTSPVGAMRGSRDGGGHIWVQQSFDQHSIVRPYVKWDKRLEVQDNPGLTISRALQVARTEPCGPVYVSFPREVSLTRMQGAKFPTVHQLGLTRPAAPDPGSVRIIAERLIEARNPAVVVSRSGRNPETVAPLVALCELLGLGVHDPATPPSYLSFPLDHPLYQGKAGLDEADAVLVLEADVPWMPGPKQPPDDAFVAFVDVDPAKRRIPSYEFTADLRLAADTLQTVLALTEAVRGMIDKQDTARCAARSARLAAASAARWAKIEDDARSRARKTPIDVFWLNHQVGRFLDANDNALLIDETINVSEAHRFMRMRRPGSYFYNPGSSGGWAPGAALGAKLAAPERDVIALSGDGFYMFGTPTAALWSARHYGAPYLQVVYQNRSYSTGTMRINAVYPGGHSAQGGYEGGYFDPPMDFAKEAEAAGAYGENVRDPAGIMPALERGLAETRRGSPAVIAVWLPRLLQND